MVSQSGEYSEKVLATDSTTIALMDRIPKAIPWPLA
jgi:hypothetical protein